MKKEINVLQIKNEYLYESVLLRNQSSTELVVDSLKVLRRCFSGLVNRNTRDTEHCRRITERLSYRVVRVEYTGAT